MAERFPTWKQALVTCLGGVVLAGTSCFGFFLTLSGNFERGGDNVLTALTAIGFGIGIVVVGVGIVFVLMRIVRAMTEKRPSGPPSPPYPPASPPPPPPPAPTDSSNPSVGAGE
jgi:hypothetical protein